jgi:hypothetical protein
MDLTLMRFTSQVVVAILSRATTISFFFESVFSGEVMFLPSAHLDRKIKK